MANTGITPTPVQRYDKTDQAVENVEFETYLYGWVQHIRAEQEYTRALDQAAVTMHVRARGVTISDMVSGYGTRAETNGTWMQYDPNLDGEVHPINIVGPAITTNKNACLQSNAAVEVRSANASAQHKQIAMRWQKIADYIERTTWTEAKRGLMFDDAQKGGTLWIDSYCKPAEKQIVPRLHEVEKGIGVITCEACGAAGVLDIEEFTEEGMAEVPCPKCGQPATAAVTSERSMQMEEDEDDTYEIVDRVIPFFNFSVDMYGAKVEGIPGAQWACVNWLRDLNYMQTHYRNLAFTGPGLWSYKARCDWALSRGRFDYLNRQPRQVGWGWGHERYEEMEVYLAQEAYSSYRAPEDFEFVNADGEKTFAIKKGQGIGEALEAMYGYRPTGLKFYWCEDRLLTIPSAKHEEMDFRHRISDMHWSRESGSYLSSPNYSIVYIQDDITLLNTLNHNIIARNAVNPLFFDSTVFEEGDFSKEFIGSKNAALLEEFDIRKAITALPIPTPSPHLSAQMQWLWSIKDSVSQVTPAMRGESQQNAPYAAQRQQLEQSYGNLTSVLKSFAQCKVSVFRNKARLMKQKWTNQQFQDVGSMFGELWTDEDVEEMCEIDLDRDLIVSYRPGSEMPSTPMGKEMKFFGALAQLLPLVQVFPQLVGTDKMTQILQKIDEFGEFDFDLTGLEVNELVAQKRYNMLAELCEPYAGMTIDDIAMARQNVIATEPPPPEVIQQSITLAQSAPDDPQVIAQAQAMVQPTEITEFDALSEEIITNADIQFSRYENLDQQKSFFVEMLNNEIGKPKPNYLFISIMEEILDMMTEFVNGMKAEQMANDPEIQAAQAADQAAQADAAAERDLRAAEMGLKAEMQDKEIAARKEESQANLMGGLLTQQADHEQQADIKALDIVAQEAAAAAKPQPAAKPQRPKPKKK